MEVFDFLRWAVYLLIFLFGLGIMVVMYMYLVDVTQTRHAVRRNYPVIGRFRYLFEQLGEFFRQYFFAMDREEMPFNRAERSWVYRTAKNEDNTVAFGSTRRLNAIGEVLFMNSPFPLQAHEGSAVAPLEIGAGRAKLPYLAPSLFNISGMSYGAISRPAVLALSRGAHEAGIWMNTGEGGLSPYHREGGCDLVYQIGTAKYGVRDEQGDLSDDKLRELAQYETLRMFEIKLSQGAKPGKGGILPGRKVTSEIAAIRGISVGEDSRSPNAHLDIQSVEDLLKMIGRVRSITGRPVGFKAVLGGHLWLRELLETIHRLGIDSAPDFITIDSADGGTGAAPQSLMDYVGLPLRESLPIAVDLLNEYGLRQEIRIIASGKLITPGSIAWALCMGADFVSSARGFMFALGCIQALQCNRDTCPTGITTHNPRLQHGLVPNDKARRVAHYARNMVQEVQTIAHSCGAKEARELRRTHARLVMQNSLSAPLDELYPVVETRPEYMSAASG